MPWLTDIDETPGAALREAFEPISGTTVPTTVPILPDRLESIESHVDTLTHLLRQLQAQSSQNSRRESSSSLPTLPMRTPSGTQETPLARTQSNGQSFSGIDANLRFVDLASLTSMCDEVTELGELLSNQARYLLDSDDDTPADADVQPGPSTETSAQGPLPTQQQASNSILDLNPSTSPTTQAGLVQSPAGIDWSYLDELLRVGSVEQPAGAEDEFDSRRVSRS